MVLSAAGTFALHDAARGVDAAVITDMAGWVRLELDFPLYGGEAFPALASDEIQIFDVDVAKELAANFANLLQFVRAVEVFDVRHLPFLILRPVSSCPWQISRCGVDGLRY